jgi:NAD(P)-dependent dehydrogenase (short-subunit alcohol dehydrogenase family)
MKQVIVITGASSGFGALAARRLADAGHTVYAGMRATAGRNSTQVEAVNQYAKEHHVEPCAITRIPQPSRGFAEHHASGFIG